MPWSSPPSRAVSAPDERGALDLGEAHGERGEALTLARAAHAWTRDLLVTRAGLPQAIEARELAQLCGQVAGALAPAALLEQARLCARVIEALEQNGNGRLQVERLALGMRELRHG